MTVRLVFRSMLPPYYPICISRVKYILATVTPFAIAIVLILGTQQGQPEITVQADKTERNGNVVQWTGNVAANYQDLKVMADNVPDDGTNKVPTGAEHLQ